MGSEYSVAADQDSPTEPGQKSVLSTELPIAAADLKDGIMEFLRDPMGMPQNQYLFPSLKAVEFTGESDTGYTVKVVLDGKKLDAFKLGNGKGTDRAQIWMTVAYDPSTQIITTVNHVPQGGPTGGGAWVDEASEDQKLLSTCTRILEDPVRVEYWWIYEGNRVAGQIVADTFFGGYLKPIVDLYQTRSVRFEHDQDSVAEPGKKCITSNALDELCSFDNLWQVLTNWSKLPGFEDKEIQEVSPTEVVISGQNGVEPPEGIWKMQFCQEGGTGKVIRENIRAGKTREMHYTYLRQDPLVVEHYSDYTGEDGKHLVCHDRKAALVFAGIFDQAVQKANSWW